MFYVFANIGAIMKIITLENKVTFLLVVFNPDCEIKLHYLLKKIKVTYSTKEYYK